MTPVVVDPGSSAAQWALTSYFTELRELFGASVDLSHIEAARTAYVPPNGLFLLVPGEAEPAVACGAVQWLDDERGEVKRMWVAPSHRGRGISRKLLQALEDLIRESGRTTAVLDTREALTSAVALYDSSGYERVERYNDNPNAQLWFRKDLTAG